MLFASVDLAARVEAAECALLTACVAASARRRGEVLARPLAGGLASFVAAGSPLNKIAGLGFAGPVDPADFAAVEDEFRRRGAAPQVEVATLADPSILALLQDRGYRLVGFENVLACPLPAQAPATAPAIEITPSPPDQVERWLNVMIDGFANPDAQGLPSHESFPRDLLRAVMADMAEAAGVVRLLAHREGSTAGAATLHLGQGVALLCGAATLPAHRRRGVQSALLTHRLAAAAAAGCELAVVTTQPGSKSQENVQRLGFALLYARAIFVGPAPAT